MLASKRKDLLLRKKFFKIEKLKKIKKFLTIHLLCNPRVSNRINPSLLFLTKKNKLHTRNSKVRIKNICVNTNRTRGVSKFFSLSRLSQKDLIQFGIIPGYIQAVW